MQTRRLLSLIALVAAVTASHSAVAATKKADESSAALVAALQAVSPDPLCGRLGLAATTARPTDKAASATVAGPRQTTAQYSAAERDRRAYLIWKSSQKS